MAVSYETVVTELRNLMATCQDRCEVKREDYNECFCEKYDSLDTAIYCVQRRIPMKPDDILWEKNEEGHFVLSISRCPFCNQGVNAEMKFCDICGQALKWEDEE